MHPKVYKHPYDLNFHMYWTDCQYCVVLDSDLNFDVKETDTCRNDHSIVAYSLEFN